MAIFDEKIEIRERCKGVHCVDLGESFPTLIPTRIYLQKSASIEPRTSPSKFGGNFNALFIRLLNTDTRPSKHAQRLCRRSSSAGFCIFSFQYFAAGSGILLRRAGEEPATRDRSRLCCHSQESYLGKPSSKRAAAGSASDSAARVCVSMEKLRRSC